MASRRLAQMLIDTVKPSKSDHEIRCTGAVRLDQDLWLAQQAALPGVGQRSPAVPFPAVVWMPRGEYVACSGSWLENRPFGAVRPISSLAPGIGRPSGSATFPLTTRDLTSELTFQVAAGRQGVRACDMEGAEDA